MHSDAGIATICTAQQLLMRMVCQHLLLWLQVWALLHLLCSCHAQCHQLNKIVFQVVLPRVVLAAASALHAAGACAGSCHQLWLTVFRSCCPGLCWLLHLHCMLQVLALAAVRATKQLTQRCRDIIAANLAAADAFFARWTDIFEWHKPQGGPIAFPRIRTGEAVEEWCEQVVKESGVLLLPASVYDHEASVSRGHFRIGLGRQNMPQCLEQLDAWLVKKFRS
jgi:hypothetical protein